MINQFDAAARKIKAGDMVKVFNGRGEFLGLAKISNDLNTGIILATLG